MIFKRLAANLRGQNWSAIAIEFAIVVAGVFVGTQVSNWNAARIDRANSARLLAQLVPELRAQVDFYDTAKIYYATTRRFADIATLREETKAWSSDVNATQRGVDWQMKIDDARTKLKSVYPTIKL